MDWKEFDDAVRLLKYAVENSESVGDNTDHSPTGVIRAHRVLDLLRAGKHPVHIFDDSDGWHVRVFTAKQVGAPLMCEARGTFPEAVLTAIQSEAFQEWRKE